MDEIPFLARKGRGAVSNYGSRFNTACSVPVDDGWPDQQDADLAPSNATQVSVDTARTIITRNSSPDVPFEQSVNPYRGCEHGCVYCFARPAHAYLGLSPGLDFETRLFCKPNAAELLTKELSRPGYRCRPIALGINTDGWQPLERKLKITRQIIEVMNEYKHPFSVVTKSALIERDLDILGPMAQQGLVEVALSVTTLDPELARSMEPRANAPHRRLRTIRTLADAGIPVTVLVAPLIPVLTDAELETILAEARAAGASSAGYILLRMPHEIKHLFREWLEVHRPGMADHLFKRIREAHGGKDYDASFGTRMTGTGHYAGMLAQRFRSACRKLGYCNSPTLRTEHFSPPADATQMNLF